MAENFEAIFGKTASSKDDCGDVVDRHSKQDGVDSLQWKPIDDSSSEQTESAFLRVNVSSGPSADDTARSSRIVGSDSIADGENGRSAAIEKRLATKRESPVVIQDAILDPNSNRSMSASGFIRLVAETTTFDETVAGASFSGDGADDTDARTYPVLPAKYLMPSPSYSSGETSRSSFQPITDDSAKTITDSLVYTGRNPLGASTPASRNRLDPQRVNAAEYCRNEPVQVAGRTSRENDVMTRSEPMGEESENDGRNFVNPIASRMLVSGNEPAFDDCDSCDLDYYNDSCSAYSTRDQERPPVLGQCNDPRGQVTSGMSAESSDVRSASVNSDDGNVRDVLSEKVSALLGEEVVADGRDCSNVPSDDEGDAGASEDSGINREGVNDESLKMADEPGSETRDKISGKQSPAEFGLANPQAMPKSKVPSLNRGKSKSSASFVEVGDDGDIVVLKSVKNRHKHGGRKENADAETDLSFSDQKPCSPTSVSSVASSKRLEWDSGADIGYKSVPATSMSCAEADILRWANRCCVPLTRSEPEGKSFNKEKNKRIPPQNVGDNRANDVGGRQEGSKLGSSATSISSELFTEGMYGASKSNRRSSDSDGEDVIKRVRRLLDGQRNVGASSDRVVVMEGENNEGRRTDDRPTSPKVKFQSERCRFVLPRNLALAEISPSHSSSSWSTKSSNTVVMTPVGRCNEEAESNRSSSSGSEAAVAKSDHWCIEDDEALVYFREDQPYRVNVASASVQTDPSGGGQVPKPVFPRGRSKSLDILPTVLVDVAVNTDLPYSPSSEENVASPDDATIVSSNLRPSGTAASCEPSDCSQVTKIPRNSVALQVGSLDDINRYREMDDDRLRMGRKARRPHLGTNVLAMKAKLAVLSRRLPDAAFDDAERIASGDGITSAPGKRHILTTSTADTASSPTTMPLPSPHWPSDATDMFYAISDDKNSKMEAEFKFGKNYVENASPVMQSNGQTVDERNVGTFEQSDKRDYYAWMARPATTYDGSHLRTKPGNRSSASPAYRNVSTDEVYSPVNVSEQCSTDVSLPTKKFVDRSEWLHEMSRLEDRTRSDQSFRVERPDSNRGEDAVARSSEEELMWHERKTSRSVASTSSTDLDSFHLKSGNVKRRVAAGASPSRERLARKASYDSHVGDRGKVGQAGSSSLRSEISRLKTLILRERQSCLRRLWRDVDKIERIESAFVGSPLGSSTLSPSENDLMRYLTNRRNDFDRKRSNDACASDVRESSPSGESQPHTSHVRSYKHLNANPRSKRVLKSYRSSKHPMPKSKVGVSVGLQTTSPPNLRHGSPREQSCSERIQATPSHHRRVKPSDVPSEALRDVRKRSQETGRNSSTSSECKSVSSLKSKKDFGQLFPSPIPRDKILTGRARSSVSVGLQTTPSLTNIANRSSDESVGRNSSRNVALRKPVCWVIPYKQANDGAAARTEPSTVSLQKAFEEKQGSLCDRMRIRHLKISLATVERREEYAYKRVLIRNAGEFGTNFVPSTSRDERTLIFTHKQMRQQTERVYRTLPEVVAKNDAKMKQEEYRTNRMMADIYRKKVQEKTLQGHVSWLHTHNCI